MTPQHLLQAEARHLGPYSHQATMQQTLLAVVPNVACWQPTLHLPISTFEDMLDCGILLKSPKNCLFCWETKNFFLLSWQQKWVVNKLNEKKNNKNCVNEFRKWAASAIIGPDCPEFSPRTLYQREGTVGKPEQSLIEASLFRPIDAGMPQRPFISISGAYASASPNCGGNNPETKPLCQRSDGFLLCTNRDFENIAMLVFPGEARPYQLISGNAATAIMNCPRVPTDAYCFEQRPQVFINEI